MRWYQSNKPVSLIEACVAEAEELRAVIQEQDPFWSQLYEAQQNMLFNDGWCAPAEIFDEILNANGKPAFRWSDGI